MANEVIIRVTARDDTAGVRDVIRGGFGVTGRQAGEEFGKGLDEGAKSTAKKAGEDAAEEAKKSATAKAKADAGGSGGGGILGPLLLAGAPLAGAAAGAAVVAGVGIGLIGLGAKVAASTEPVKNQLQLFGAQVRTLSSAWGTDMQKPVTEALGVMRAGFGQLGPVIGQALGNVSPDVVILSQGLTSLATNAMPGVVSASGKMIPVFQGLSGALGTVGQATGQMASDVASHSTTIGTSIGFVGQIVASLETTLGHVVGDMADTFAHTGGTLVTTLHTLGDVISGLSSTALPALGGGIQADLTVINSLISALGPVSSLLGTFGGTALSAYMNVSLLGKLQGPINSAADSLEKAGTKGTTFGDVTTKVSGGLKKVGDSLPYVGVGLAIIGTAMELDSAHANALTDASDKLAAGLEQGGIQAAQARKQLEDARVANQNYTNSAIALSASQKQGTQDSSTYGTMVASNARDIGELTAKVQDNKQVADDALKKYNDWAAGMGLTGITASQLAGDTDILAASTQSASSNTSQLKSDLDILNTAASTADAKVKALADSLAILGDHGMQKAQDYAAQFGTALDNFAQQMTTAKGAVFGLNGELDTNSARGRDVLSVLEQAQQSWAGQAQAMADAGQSTDQINAALDRNRQQLYNVLAAAGLTKGQINNLIDTYGLVPKDISTKVHADTSQAVGDTKALLQWIGNQRAVIRVDAAGNAVSLHYTDSRVTAQAGGGVVGGAASGMALPGGLRIVGEQGAEVIRESAGASVIPRSGIDKAITDAMGSASGGGVMPVLEIRAPGDELSQLLAMIIKKYVRVVGGGNVQTAFGQGS